MKKCPDARRYEQLYYLISQRVERRALFLIAMLLMLLVLCQLLLLIPDLRKMMTTIDRLEGNPIHMHSINKDRIV